jgi:hypothetical protein
VTGTHTASSLLRDQQLSPTHAAADALRATDASTSHSEDAAAEAAAARIPCYSFPPKATNWQEWQDLAASRQPEEAGAGNPFEWVPEAGSSAGPSPMLRPKSAHIPTKTPTSMPLEYFDDPSMEQQDPQLYIDAGVEAGLGGAPAVSRFYNTNGEFCWRPCLVLEYNRWEDQPGRSGSTATKQHCQRRMCGGSSSGIQPRMQRMGTLSAAVTCAGRAYAGA